MAAAASAVPNFKLKAELTGHGDWVTALCTPTPAVEDGSQAPPIFISASRDKTAIVWRIKDTQEVYAVPERSLVGHSHFVSDVALSESCEYALTASWDCSLRLWDLSTGETVVKFIDHTKDVLSVAFDPTNHMIVSGGRDNAIKFWTVKGDCILTLDAKNAKAGQQAAMHTDWVSCVRFAPAEEPAQPGEDGQPKYIYMSAGWDGVVKVWSHDCSLRQNLTDHTGYVNTLTMAIDASLAATGGRDGRVILWQPSDPEGRVPPPPEHPYKYDEFNAGSEVFSLAFNPSEYFLAGATKDKIIIWDLERDSKSAVIAELDPFENKERSAKALKPYATSIAWSPDGRTLYAGYTDNKIRVWQMEMPM